MLTSLVGSEMCIRDRNDTGTFGGDTSENGAEGDASITGTLTFTDAADGDSSPNYEVTTDPAGGSASIDPVTGVWTYEPDTDFNGEDTFTVTVSDDDGHTEEQDVEVTLSAVNDTGSFGGDTSENGVEGDPSITGTLTFTDVIDLSLIHI